MQSFLFDTNVVLKNRQEAGRVLAQKIKSVLSSVSDAMVVALPPGGVPIAFEISEEFSIPLCVLAASKIRAPSRPDLIIGAITEEGHHHIDDFSSRLIGTSRDKLEQTLAREKLAIESKVRRYRPGEVLPDLKNKTIILVDDGPTSNMTARVVASYLRFKEVRQIVLAVPVCAKQSVAELTADFDHVISLYHPGPFFSMRDYFLDFRDISDEEVQYLLSKSRKKKFANTEKAFSRKVLIPVEGSIELQATLSIPTYAKGIVLFAHPNSSKRFEYRNNMIAEELNRIGIATLLFDSLTDDESLERANVFDIPFLASRLAFATKWVRLHRMTRELSIGFLSEGSGAAAALWASTYLGADVSSIVSRGGRPDLAQVRLTRVNTPTLLIVGDQDTEIIEINKNCLRTLSSGKLILIPGASHLFDEPNTIEEVSREASLWFLKNFKTVGTAGKSRDVFVSGSLAKLAAARPRSRVRRPRLFREDLRLH